MAFIRQYVELRAKRILDVGCGLGMYVSQFRQFSDDVYGVDIDPDKIDNREIMTGNHCFGCTAGAGSTCGGAIVA